MLTSARSSLLFCFAKSSYRNSKKLYFSVEKTFSIKMRGNERISENLSAMYPIFPVNRVKLRHSVVCCNGYVYENGFIVDSMGANENRFLITDVGPCITNGNCSKDHSIEKAQSYLATKFKNEKLNSI